MEFITPVILACAVAALVILDIAGVCDGVCRKMNKRFKADQEELSQGNAEAACRAHTPDVAGSIPAPATNFDLFFSKFGWKRAPRNHRVSKVGKWRKKGGRDKR